MAEHTKVYFDREVQAIMDLHQFEDGDGAVVFVQAPTLLQAILGWAKVIDMDPDELSTFYRGLHVLTVCDKEISLPKDQVLDMDKLGYQFVDTGGPTNVVFAYQKELGVPEANAPGPRWLNEGWEEDAYHMTFGVRMYLVP